METQLYYLQSRYYDPEVCRFINSDEVEKSLFMSFREKLLGGANQYSYCINNPINNYDSSGFWLARLLSAILTAAVFATLAFIVCKIVGQFVPIDKKTIAIVTLACAALGGLIGALLGPSFMAKHAPNLLKAINKIEKQKFTLKAIGPNTSGNIFGIVISNTLIIMLHAPHPKFNEWFFHLQVEVKISKKQITILKLPIWKVNPTKWGK